MPDEYHVRARLFSTYVRDRWTPGDKLTIDFGTRWEYFPVPTRPDRGIERYDVDTGQGAALRGRRRYRRTAASRSSKTRFGPRVGLAYRFGDKWVVRAGYGLTNDPYYGMELIRANYPILIQVKLESPDGLTPAATLSQGIPAVQVPGGRQRHPGHPERLCVAGLPEGARPRDTSSRGTSPSSGSCRGSFTGQVGYVATRTTRQLGLLDINAGQVIGAGEDGRPLLQQVRPDRVHRVAAAGRRWQVRLDAGAAAAAVRGRPQPRRELHARAGRISPNENSSLHAGDTVQALAYLSRNLRATRAPIDGTTWGSPTSGRFPSDRTGGG